MDAWTNGYGVFGGSGRLAGGTEPVYNPAYGSSSGPYFPTSDTPFASSSFTYEANDERVSESRAQVTQYQPAQASASTKNNLGGVPVFVKMPEKASQHDVALGVFTLPAVNLFLRAFVQDTNKNLKPEDVMKLFAVPGINRTQVEHNDKKQQYVNILTNSAGYFQMSILMEGLFDQIPNTWGDVAPLQIVGFVLSPLSKINLKDPISDIKDRPLQLVPAWTPNGTRRMAYKNYSLQMYLPHRIQPSYSYTSMSRKRLQSESEYEQDYPNFLAKRQRESAIAAAQTAFPLAQLPEAFVGHNAFNTLSSTPKANYLKMKATLRRMVDRAFLRSELGLDESTIELVEAVPSGIKSVTNTCWSVYYDDGHLCDCRERELRAPSYQGNHLQWQKMESYWEILRVESPFIPIGIVTSTTAGLILSQTDVDRLVNSRTVEEGYEIYKEIYQKTMISLCVRVR